MKISFIYCFTVVTFLFHFSNVIAQSNSNGDSIQHELKNLVFTKVETDAAFPGGDEAWLKYINAEIKKGKLNHKDAGTCIIKFIVNKDGTIADVTATTMKGSRLAEISINAIKNGPTWIPAQQNGQSVNAFHMQSVVYRDGVTKSNFSNKPKSKYVLIRDTKKNVAQKDYHKIIMFGTGSPFMRLFVDNLYEEMATGFEKKKIESNYHFLGSDSSDAMKKFAQFMQAESFDAILVFTQAGYSEVTEMNYIEELNWRGMNLNQMIKIQLIDRANNHQPVWEAMIKADFDFTRKKAYKEIANQIFRNMKENKICD